ncbi:hypothetical protein T492DRAFT_1141813 [Pavlovales sp. CCMP2436]|nr:hypothetical protein T492DRAFT_1141813 [Pavlovales sp. CCMP2436]
MLYIIHIYLSHTYCLVYFDIYIYMYTAVLATAVLATVSPGCTATEHTLHTLQTVTAMCALDGHTCEESVDVVAAQLYPPPPVPPKDWPHETLLEWMCALKAGRFRAQALAMPTDLDGKRLCRMPATYFTQVLCAGNDALGAALYNEVHTEMDLASRLKHEHVKLMRNARSAAKLGR